MKSKTKISIICISLILAIALFFVLKPAITGHVISKNKPALEEILSLPYLQYTEEKADQNLLDVTHHDEEKADPGYNLYTTTEKDSKLFDMNGKEINTWENMGHVLILDNGRILARDNQKGFLGMYSWDSELIWQSNVKIHHEISLASESNILTASREVQEYNGRKVEFGVVVELDMDGNELWRWSTWENFDKLKTLHPPRELDQPSEVKIKEDQTLKEKQVRFGGDYDYYHLNSIQELPENKLGKADKRFQKGNLLICLKYVNLILILDKDTKEIVWDWGIDKLDYSHMPRMSKNGNILIFDNGVSRKYSRIIELNPLTKEIVWEYTPTPKEDFYTGWGGSNQQLPNRNILVGEATKGHVFEITKQGEIVWEWWNPKLNKNGKRETIYRIARYNKEKIEKILKQNEN